MPLPHREPSLSLSLTFSFGFGFSFIHFCIFFVVFFFRKVIFSWIFRASNLAIITSKRFYETEVGKSGICVDGLE